MSTDNKRKHYTQMNGGEIAVVKTFINNVPRYNFIPHSIEKLLKRKVDRAEVEQAIREGEIIEVHNNKWWDFRVLVRLNLFAHKRAVCVVLSGRNKNIVTCYLNDVNDNHSTIDMTNYTWTPNVTEQLIQGIITQ